MPDAGWSPGDEISVLHVVSYYPPDRVGGVGEHVRLLHEGQVDCGIHSEILTSGTTRIDPRVHRVGKSPAGFLLNVWRRAGLAERFDVVHAHHGEAFLLLLLIRLHRRRPRILTMYHVDVRRREAANGPHVVKGRRFGSSGIRNVIRRISGFIKVLVDRVAWVLADAVVVETEHVREELADLTPIREVVVVPHGLDDSRRSGSIPKEVDLLYVGVPGVRKRTHLLPMILHRVLQSVPKARLRIVGFDIDSDPVLRGEANRLGVLSNIEFVGSLPSEEVVPFYRAAKLLVLPSAYEGLPMVLLEAMRERLPAVATHVSGHPDAIDDGISGFLVPVDDVDAMADRCVDLLKDPGATAEMGERARQTVIERFSLDREIDSYIKLYTSLHMRLT